MTLYFLLLFLLAIPSPQADKNAGMKIVTRHVFGGHSSETIVYKTTEKRRTEIRYPARPLAQQATADSHLELGPILIVRCDLGQSFTLNTKTAEYMSAPYPPKLISREEIASHRSANSSDGEPAKPTVRIETTTADTGERQEMFGRMARHVITTTTEIPLEGSQQQASETVTDGWYIDPDARLYCDPVQNAAGHAFLTVGAAGRPWERPEFVDHGTRETGLPVKTVRRSTPGATTTSSDGTQASEFTSEDEVTVFEVGPVDPQLFEVPEGYKPVERFTRDRQSQLP